MNTNSTKSNVREGTPIISKPLTTPLNFDLTNPPKSQLQKLMTDDFGTDNSLNFNGSFRSQGSVLKLNSVINSGLKDHANKGLRYDASFETKVFGLDTKFTLKTPNFSVLFDLGAYKWTKVISGQNRYVWFNPYIKFGMDQSLNTSDLSLGLISTLDTKCLSAHQINLNPS